MTAASTSDTRTPPPGPARLRAAIVTNIPAPYRLPVYALMAQQPDIDLHVVFCGGREPDRAWDLAEFRFEHSFLKERFATVRGRYIHANPDVWPALTQLRPRLVVTTGFNPTHLIAYAWARRHAAAHLAMTDGTDRSESRLSGVHRFLRRWIYARSAAFIGASDGSFALYRSYGVPPQALFKSHLCADNAAFARAAAVPRDVDLIFCGRFVETKQPLFALEVAAATAQRLGRKVRLLLVGSGPLEASMRAAAAGLASQVEAEFAGFARQAELPQHYRRARLLLFPTLGDTWGVVANEAAAARVPVLTCPEAGVAGELVRDGDTGHVLPLSVPLWAERAAELLRDDARREAMGDRGFAQVQGYSYRHAADGLCDALRHAARVAGATT